MLLATALLPAYYRMCSTDVCCSSNDVVAQETITHHFFVLQIGQKTVDAAKICVAQKMLLNKTQQTFVNGLLSFITDIILRWKRVCIMQ